MIETIIDLIPILVMILFLYGIYHTMQYRCFGRLPTEDKTFFQKIKDKIQS